MQVTFERNGVQKSRRKGKGKAPPRPRPKSEWRGKAVPVALCAATTTVLFSMGLNCWAFTLAQPTWFGYACGVALPLWVLALTYLGHALHGVCRWTGVASYALAGGLLLVSMPHLAHGYHQLLAIASWEGWALAVVTDLLQVVAKVAVIKLRA
jgi:hypothetical protein